MKLRKEIEPDFDIAEKRYPEVLKLILAYTDFCDKNGDEDFIEYKKLENTLNKMTGKNISQFNLWEWWEEEGAEVLAFRIALPDAQKVSNITKDELAEIVKRLKQFVEIDESDKSFKAEFQYQIDAYYYEFLKLNFKTYHPTLFQRNKDNDGNYFEYTKEEIVEKIWTHKPNQL